MSKLINMGGTPPTNNIPTANFDLKSKPRVECSCGCVFFKQVVGLKKVSRLEVAAGNGDTPVLIPIPIFRCDDCGEVLSEFVPEQF